MKVIVQLSAIVDDKHTDYEMEIEVDNLPAVGTPVRFRPSDERAADCQVLDASVQGCRLEVLGGNKGVLTIQVTSESPLVEVFEVMSELGWKRLPEPARSKSRFNSDCWVSSLE